MTRNVAATVTLDPTGLRVLLIHRRDYRAWGLPGGKVENGETPEQAAMRETLEETGCAVEIIRLVGSYEQPQFDDIRHVYQARMVGGAPIRSNRETLAVNWFPLDDLPFPLMPWTRQILQDALDVNTGPVQKRLRAPGWQATAARLFLSLRRGWKALISALKGLRSR